MKVFSIAVWLLAAVCATEAISIPNTLDRRFDTSVNELVKRKGGGGGGHSSGGSSSGGSSHSSGSSSGGKSGSSSSSSNAGGSSSKGSGSPPTYGGGRYYGGGATVPFTAGGITAGGIAAVGLLSIGTLAFFHGPWLYPAYLYPYSHNYTFHNASTGHNETKPVKCLCQEYSECGCDDNGNSTYFNSVVGDGTHLNSSLVQAATVNGTDTIFLNGTLPNGTTAASAASGLHGKAIENIGWCLIGSLVAMAMWTL